MGISACSRVISAFRCLEIDSQLFLGFVGGLEEPLAGNRPSVVGRESRSEPVCAAGGVFTIIDFDGR